MQIGGTITYWTKIGPEMNEKKSVAVNFKKNKVSLNVFSYHAYSWKISCFDPFPPKKKNNGMAILFTKAMKRRMIRIV